MSNINIFENSDIETIFKVEPPLTETKSGFGFDGVILRDKIKDKIQCHICGGWYDFLSIHVNQKHKINSRDYKMKYQLPLGFPLANKRILSIMSRKSRENKNGLKNLEKRNILKASHSRKKRMFKYCFSNLSFQNKKGICEKQIMRRFLIVSDIVGRTPSLEDLIEYDHSLWAAIRRRYGTINNFKRKNNFEYQKSYKEVTESKVIATIRKFYRKNKRIPRINDFRTGSPCSKTILKIFGSFHKALLMSGFNNDKQ